MRTKLRVVRCHFTSTGLNFHQSSLNALSPWRICKWKQQEKYSDLYSIKTPEQPITLGNDYPRKDVLSFWNVHFLYNFSFGESICALSDLVLGNLLWYSLHTQHDFLHTQYEPLHSTKDYTVSPVHSFSPIFSSISQKMARSSRLSCFLCEPCRLLAFPVYFVLLNMNVEF